MAVAMAAASGSNGSKAISRDVGPDDVESLSSLLGPGQYSTTGLPGEPVAPIIFNGAQMNAPS